jgi:hypothetical protein
MGLVAPRYVMVIQHPGHALDFKYAPREACARHTVELYRTCVAAWPADAHARHWHISLLIVPF